MKVFSYPGHGNSMCCITGNWTVSEFKSLHLPSKKALNSSCFYTKQQATNLAVTLASPRSQRLSSCSSWRPQLKWWTGCCDQLFRDFITPQLWVAQQCTSSTPPPISRSGRHIDVLDLDGSRGGNKRTLRGSVKIHRPSRKKDGQIGGLLPSIKTATVHCPTSCYTHVTCFRLPQWRLLEWGILRLRFRKTGANVPPCLSKKGFCHLTQFLTEAVPSQNSHKYGDIRAKHCLTLT